MFIYRKGSVDNIASRSSGGFDTEFEGSSPATPEDNINVVVR